MTEAPVVNSFHQHRAKSNHVYNTHEESPDAAHSICGMHKEGEIDAINAHDSNDGHVAEDRGPSSDWVGTDEDQEEDDCHDDSDASQDRDWYGPHWPLKRLVARAVIVVVVAVVQRLVAHGLLSLWSLDFSEDTATAALQGILGAFGHGEISQHVSQPLQLAGPNRGHEFL